MKHIELGTTILPYERVQPRPRQVRVILRLRDGVLEVSAPSHITDKTIQQVIRKHAKWIQAQITAAQNRVVRPLQVGDRLLLEGFLWNIQRRREDTWCESITMDPALKIIYADETLTPEQIHEQIYQRLRNTARNTLQDLVKRLAHQHCLTPRRIVVKEQARRWGSCSSAGNININWRLIQAPRCVQTYVAIHELAHLREMNHSDQFWNVVSKMMPDYASPRQWLRKHSEQLYRLQETGMQFDEQK